MKKADKSNFSYKIGNFFGNLFVIVILVLFVAVLLAVTVSIIRLIFGI